MLDPLPQGRLTDAAGPRARGLVPGLLAVACLVVPACAEDPCPASTTRRAGRCVALPSDAGPDSGGEGANASCPATYDCSNGLYCDVN